MTNVFMYIIISIAATHKEMLSRDDDGAVYLSREVYQYRSQALRRLNQRLRDPKSQVDDFTLLCVMSLQLAEVSNFPSSQTYLFSCFKTTVTDLRYPSFNNLQLEAGLPTSREQGD